MIRCVLGGRLMAIGTGIGFPMAGGRPDQYPVEAMTLSAIIMDGVIGDGSRYTGNGPRCAGMTSGTFRA